MKKRGGANHKPSKHHPWRLAFAPSRKSLGLHDFESLLFDQIDHCIRLKHNKVKSQAGLPGKGV